MQIKKIHIKPIMIICPQKNTNIIKIPTKYPDPQCNRDNDGLTKYPQNPIQKGNMT